MFLFASPLNALVDVGRGERGAEHLRNAKGRGRGAQLCARKYGGGERRAARRAAGPWRASLPRLRRPEHPAQVLLDAWERRWGPAEACRAQMPRLRRLPGFPAPGPHLLAALVEARRRLTTRPRLLLRLTHGGLCCLVRGQRGAGGLQGRLQGTGERGRGGASRPLMSAPLPPSPALSAAIGAAKSALPRLFHTTIVTLQLRFGSQLHHGSTVSNPSSCRPLV